MDGDGSEFAPHYGKWRFDMEIKKINSNIV